MNNMNNSPTTPARQSRDHGQSVDRKSYDPTELSLALLGRPWGDSGRTSRSYPRLAALALEELVDGGEARSL